MKANELRIGNLVSAYGSIMPVVSIGKFGISAETDKHSVNIKYTHPELIPIPLTEGWLLRFGFIKLDEHDVFYILKFNMNLKVSGDCTMVAWHNLMLHEVSIKYVHQLQNLYFALTGGELEVKP